MRSKVIVTDLAMQADSLRSDTRPHFAATERIEDAEAVDYAVKDQVACCQA